MSCFKLPYHTFLAALVLSLLAGCTASGLTARDPEVRRQAILDMRNEVLTELYELRPDTEAQIFSAVGFAVFSNASVGLIVNVGGGVGILRNNGTGEDLYLRMGEVGVGVGAGVTDIRLVMVFHSEDALQRFTDAGFTVGGDADVAARGRRAWRGHRRGSDRRQCHHLPDHRIRAGLASFGAGRPLLARPGPELEPPRRSRNCRIRGGQTGPGRVPVQNRPAVDAVESAFKKPQLVSPDFVGIFARRQHGFRR